MKMDLCKKSKMNYIYTIDNKKLGHNLHTTPAEMYNLYYINYTPTGT